MDRGPPALGWKPSAWHYHRELVVLVTLLRPPWATATGRSKSALWSFRFRPQPSVNLNGRGYCSPHFRYH
jgi:hypothetical protein